MLLLLTSLPASSRHQPQGGTFSCWVHTLCLPALRLLRCSCSHWNMQQALALTKTCHSNTNTVVTVPTTFLMRHPVHKHTIMSIMCATPFMSLVLTETCHSNSDYNIANQASCSQTHNHVMLLPNLYMPLFSLKHATVILTLTVPAPFLMRNPVHKHTIMSIMSATPFIALVLTETCHSNSAFSISNQASCSQTQHNHVNHVILPPPSLPLFSLKHVCHSNSAYNISNEASCSQTHNHVYHVCHPLHCPCSHWNMPQ